ncbi:HEAT repeat-containing protein [Rivularia sp. PCC 7116]|uniref:HEAT repeat domain-containing protein n=1 Tax=Rivularia sp. PCC 7116 TaxID=373994 RepID=UPI00029F0CDA|nr:HEAT repeat domain-containing protein [Rivularia sp. PCC 7116]AFY53577.1 HEAT repeat-containing protein [Rivularia sp. PCC 7116]
MSEACLGRTQEINKFTQAIDALTNPEVSSQPYIFLYYGNLGIGKTTLLKKLEEVAKDKLEGNLNTIFIDWQKEYYRIYDAQSWDEIQPTNVLEVIYKSFYQAGKANYFDNYVATTNYWEEAKKKINQALESELENEAIQELIPLGADGIAQLINKDKYNSEEEEFKVAREFVESLLTTLEQGIYQNPENNLVGALSSGITKLAKEKPLIIFIDTYEIVEKAECDYILRQAIKKSNGPIVWVIAGRANLADSGWKNQGAKDALLAALHEEQQDADVIAVAIKLLGIFDNSIAVQELVSFLQHQDRFVRQAAARELGKLVKYEADREKVFDLAVEPLIQIMRNDAISNVRDTALEALAAIYEQQDLLKNKSAQSIKLQRALWQEKDKNKFSEYVINSLIRDREQQQSSLVNIDSLSGLISNLKDSKVEVRESSIELIAKKITADKEVGSGVIDLLIGLLKKSAEDADVRVAVVEAVKEIGACSQHIIDTLIDTLNFEKESDRYLRQAAAEVLGKLAVTNTSSLKDSVTKKIADALNKAAREDVISNVRNTAQESLNDIFNQTGSELAKRYLQKINCEPLEPLNIKEVNKIIYILKNRDDIDERIKAIQALSQIKSFKSISTLKKALTEQEPDICAAAADALGIIANPSALKDLLAKVKNKKNPEYYKDRIAREAVVRAIGHLDLASQQLDKEQAVEILIDIWRNDAISNVRDAVEVSMREIYRRNQHPDAYKALKRYPDYDNNEKQSKYDDMNTEAYYNLFFC